MKPLKILLSVLILALVQAVSLRAEEAGEWEARIVKVEGEAYVRPQDQPDQYYPAQEGAPLQAGDQIQTGSDGSCELLLEEGNLIHLNSRSQFTLTSLRKQDSSFELSFGSLLAKLTGLVQYHARVEIRTPTAVAAVRGTEFGAEAGDGETHFGVFDEGKVEVREAGGRRSVMLTPNREVNVVRGQALPEPGQLRLFREYRERMNAIRARHQALRGTWRRRDPGARARFRARLLAQRALRRQAMADRIGKLRQQNRARLQKLRAKWLRQAEQNRRNRRQELHERKRERIHGRRRFRER